MCYFHVVNCCKKSLRSHPAATQKLICDEIHHLHCSVSEQEFVGRYREVSARWRIDFPEFARYFNMQRISGHFTNWKIYCSAPGIASTNNALESFNHVIKRCCTLNAWALFWWSALKFFEKKILCSNPTPYPARTPRYHFAYAKVSLRIRQGIPMHTAGSTGQPPVLVICIPRPMHVP